MLATICKGPHLETYIKQINKKNPQPSAEKYYSLTLRLKSPMVASAQNC